MRVERYERRPLYQRIADELRAQITQGLYPPGAQLPTLVELARSYQVSDVTARKALAWLERHGIIAIRHGKRSVVLEPEIDPSGSYGKLYTQLADITGRMDSIVDRLGDLTATIRGHTKSTTSPAHRSS